MAWSKELYLEWRALLGSMCRCEEPGICARCVRIAEIESVKPVVYQTWEEATDGR